VGLFDFFKRKDEAMPKPGTPEFEAAVQGTAIPDSQSVSMGEAGWTSTSPEAGTSAADALKQAGIGPEQAKALGIDPDNVEVTQSSQTIDLRGSGAREKIEEVLREKGIDPDAEGQTVDASTVPGLQEAILGALGDAGLKIPEAGGFSGGVSPPQADPLAQVEHLAAKRDAGEITDAEFEAAKRKLLGSE
jgi:hypothetical protein